MTFGTWKPSNKVIRLKTALDMNGNYLKCEKKSASWVQTPEGHMKMSKIVSAPQLNKATDRTHNEHNGSNGSQTLSDLK